MMKYTLWIILIPLMASLSIAQRVEIAGVAGYQLGGILDETEQEEGVFFPGNALGLDGSSSFGIIADVRLAKKIQLELYWDRLSTNLNFHNSETEEISKLTDISLDYYQVGLVYDWSQTKIRPFVGGTIGFVRMSPKENLESETRFAASPVVGVKSFVSRYFALRLHVRFLVTDMPEGFLFKDASGEGFHHEKSTFMTQFQFGLGAVVAL